MEYSAKDLNRFWNKVQKTDTCWIWTATTRNGYGMFRLNGTIVSAHRFSFAYHNNKNIDLIIRHKCDNPPCVNPEHLEEGTYKQNLTDSIERNRRTNWLTEQQVHEIRSIPMSTTIINDVAQAYNISESNARNVISGVTYSNLPGARKIIRQKSRSKLTVEQILEIKKELEQSWWGQIDWLARKYNVTHSQISHIKSGRIHSDVTETEYN